MEEIKIFNTFAIELVNVNTGQVVTLTMTVGTYKELGRLLTQYEKERWKMLKVTRKEN